MFALAEQSQCTFVVGLYDAERVRERNELSKKKDVTARLAVTKNRIEFVGSMKYVQFTVPRASRESTTFSEILPGAQFNSTGSD
jgi:hypothetical protein